ncbi:MAG TPA: pseudouridine synthase [Gammaproteobacteria bacterium]
MPERIQKVLANAGVGSRREVEAWIKQGRVIVDGNPARLGDRMSGTENVLLDGRPLRVAVDRRREYCLVYYKPVGEVTTRRDPERRPTIFERLKPPPNGRWISVGRLDINTSGLMLLTSDGDLAHRLMHPSYGLAREYAVRLLGSLHNEQLDRMRSGVMLDDGIAKLSQIGLQGGSGANVWYRVTLHEGRNREVRRIFDALNIPVSRLIRVRYGPIELGPMRRGETRRLSAEEIDALYAAVSLRPPEIGNVRSRI